MNDITAFELFVIEQFLRSKIAFPQDYHKTLLSRLREIYCPIMWIKEDRRFTFEDLAARARETRDTLAPVLDGNRELILTVVDPNDRYSEVVVVDNDAPEYFFDPMEIEEKKHIPKFHMEKELTSHELEINAIPEPEDTKPNIKTMNITTQDIK